MEAIQSVRGMRNILPPESSQLLALRGEIQKILHAFGYLPWELPILERTGLFQRSIGDETDIVSKEMYTFEDRSGESITLRPEGTAGVVRTMIQKGLLQTPQKLYVDGPMFRYERPQKDRYRQFSQISVECFGYPDPVLDVELIQIGAELFRKLGIRQHLTLELNTIGSAEERKRYQSALVAYLEGHLEALDEDSQRRLTSNPLRILDSKDESTRAVLVDAPQLADFLGRESQAHFARVRELLTEIGIEYRLNPYLVRGLDYYCHSVFEWTTQALGAQGTVCAGGRYDGLVAQLGGKETPAAGFAFGIDRILSLVKLEDGLPEQPLWIYAGALGSRHQARVLTATAHLRRHFPEARIYFQPADASLKNLLKKANQSGARFALVRGDAEAEAGGFLLRDLQAGTQWLLDETSLTQKLEEESHD